MSTSLSGSVQFIQYDVPPLTSGTYHLSLQQAISQASTSGGPQTPLSPGIADISVNFAVAGERLSIDPSEIHSVFPQDLANGEFSKILPHVIFNRLTLPWERASVEGTRAAPWLAVFLFNQEETANVVTQKLSAQDLVDSSYFISIYDDSGAKITTTSKGTLPAHFVSYPGIENLDYGEKVNTPCQTIDIKADLFSQIAPSILDLPYLAHCKQTTTINSVDSSKDINETSIVFSNRLSAGSKESYAFLVSLEGMEKYLPSSDGPSKNLAGVDTVRLTYYHSWKFFANTLDETLQTLLESLHPASLQLPIAVDPPSKDAVEAALAKQALGTLTQADAQVLVLNSINMGYVPLSHHLRHGGETTSWYRGPLVPYPVASNLPAPPFATPDALTQYDPDCGVFDVSYSSAWQLGQLLALQNQSFSTSLYNWKKTVQQQDIIKEENDLIAAQLLGGEILPSLFTNRTNKITTLQAASTVPDIISNWIAKLRLLDGIPFNYLIPDEKMLPQESLRFFYVDPNWIEALVDGAFSIGRTTTGELNRHAKLVSVLKAASLAKMQGLRKNPKPRSFASSSDASIISGFIMRSKAVSGWPGLNVFGYSDLSATPESAILIYKLIRISDDTLLCFFEGDVAKVEIHEPPEQIHFGVEANGATFTTGLRAIKPITLPGPQGGPQLFNPGNQLNDVPPEVVIPTRSDNQTVLVAEAANNILIKLNTPAYYNGALTSFTSAEFALEMTKGAVQVEFRKNQNTDEEDIPLTWTTQIEEALR